MYYCSGVDAARSCPRRRCSTHQPFSGLGPFTRVKRMNTTREHAAAAAATGADDAGHNTRRPSPTAAGARPHVVGDILAASSMEEVLRRWARFMNRHVQLTVPLPDNHVNPMLAPHARQPTTAPTTSWPPPSSASATTAAPTWLFPAPGPTPAIAAVGEAAAAAAAATTCLRPRTCLPTHIRSSPTSASRSRVAGAAGTYTAASARRAGGWRRRRRPRRRRRLEAAAAAAHLALLVLTWRYWRSWLERWAPAPVSW